MSLLSLTAGELRQQIDSELSANPALELVEERRCPTCQRLLAGKSACPVCSRPRQSTTGDAADEPVVFVSPREVFAGGGGVAVEDDAEDRYAAGTEELPVYVFRQIAPDLKSEDRALAAHLLANLDEDGLLSTTLLESARYLHVPISRLQAVQRLIQRVDPMGVGSSSVEEALLVQLEVLSEYRKVPVLARQIVEEGMSLLSRRQYAELARQLKVSLAAVQEAARFIGDNLNPYPARSAWGERNQTPAAPTRVYYQPDIIINQMSDRPNGSLMVEIIMPLYGTLRVNPLYRQAISESTNGEQKDALRDDLDRASLFVKCIQQRNHTIQRLMLRVVSMQREYILRGEKYLKSVTRASLAQELEVHESTISRAVSNKAVQMPNGRIVPLSSFFDRSLNVRTLLREIITKEPRPLSDSELAVMLAENGYHVARRTVAKYRAMEGILPANLRQSAV
jgi:RNA polymerase sigma-54 factor